MVLLAGGKIKFTVVGISLKLWGPPSLLFNVYQGSFHGDLNAGVSS
jgi:hypothetical protein